MSSPSSVLTEGLGSWGSVNDLVTFGLGSSDEVTYVFATPDKRFVSTGAVDTRITVAKSSDTRVSR